MVEPERAPRPATILARHQITQGQGPFDMSKLLLNEYPLIILPTLAKEIGLNEAIVLQQVHYWIVTSGTRRGKHLWTYNSYEEWRRQFPFWSVSTVKRAIRSLEKDHGLLISEQHSRWNRTKWYRIDRKKLREIERLVNLAPSKGQPSRNRRSKMSRSNTETRTETSTERRGDNFENLGDILKRLQGGQDERP